MTQLFGIVPEGRLANVLERISLCFAVAGSLVCVYLYAEHDGFLRGEKFANLEEDATALAQSFAAYIIQDDYQVLADNYFFIAVVFLIVVLVHLTTKGFTAKYINIFLLCVPVFEYWNIFTLKKLMFLYGTPRFETIRELYTFDIGIAICVASLLLTQIILVFLIRKNAKAAPSHEENVEFGH